MLLAQRRIEAATRTLLWNYGQGFWNPFNVWRICAQLLQIPARLNPLPEYKPLDLEFSFYSKRSQDGRSLCLYFPDEEREFLSQPTGVKLNWLRNACLAREFLFNFTADEICLIASLLKIRRFDYDPSRIPFAINPQPPLSVDKLQQSVRAEDV